MVKATNQEAIRRLLRQRGGGMTRNELAQELGIHIANVSRALKAMPDAYVDCWVKARRGYEKLWCAAVVPEDCPHPKSKVFRGRFSKPQTVWQPVRARQ